MLLSNLADQPAPKSDIEQIKPGAGKDTKQGVGAVDVEEGTMSGGLPEPPAKKGNSVLRWRPSSSKGKAKEESKEKLTASPDRGKFIEDVSSSEHWDQPKGGTLKKQPK
jgi:hypothetical protein